ncbi:MAG: glycosyltransferase [Bacteroidetes bacterium]|nr:glycosyltransferase [Bacteroidota bacterium]
MTLSLIVPLFNRPDEIKELLDSLALQTEKEFEVVVVEDGSDIPSDQIIEAYKDVLNIHYVTKENGGPGPARNYGAKHAEGNYLIFLDSDCIIPPDYIKAVKQGLDVQYTDAFGGPDRAHASFTPVQKSINYSMTSMLTTGGIRGGKKSMEKFHPRSFNMGISREVFFELNGFSEMRFGEDVDFSMRIMEAGHSTQLLPKAFVYHKRRTDYKKFFKQVHNSGIARINLSKRHPGTLKLVHALPSIFITGLVITIILAVLIHWTFILPYVFFLLLVFGDAAIKEKSLWVGFLSIIALTTQMAGYGSGFILAFWRRVILKKDEFQAFKRTFYK